MKARQARAGTSRHPELASRLKQNHLKLLDVREPHELGNFCDAECSQYSTRHFGGETL